MTPTATFAALTASSPTITTTTTGLSVAAAVPEPSSLVLASVAMGTAGLAWRTRRRPA